MSIRKAFTIVQSKTNKSIHILKSCYIMKHPHLSNAIWNTKIEMRLAYYKNQLSEVITMYEDQYDVPYIENIYRGDVVTRKQRDIISAWAMTKKWDLPERTNNHEV